METEITNFRIGTQAVCARCKEPAVFVVRNEEGYKYTSCKGCVYILEKKLKSGNYEMAKKKVKKVVIKEGFNGKIKCVKCESYKSVRKDIYEKRIESCGGEALLLEKYKCMECRKK